MNVALAEAYLPIFEYGVTLCFEFTSALGPRPETRL